MINFFALLRLTHCFLCVSNSLPSAIMRRSCPVDSFGTIARMHTFFHGRRRKAGIVTLVMACLVVGMWMRSLLVRDQISFWDRATLRQIASDDGTLRFGRVTWTDHDFEDVSPWPQFRISDRSSGHSNDEYWEDFEMAWRAGAGGFDFGRGFYADQQRERWVVPYWSLVTPLTLVSVYLILWKPRMAK
ncbi:MAG: hypothetical protein JWP89_4028 [Schlesneria sp.]|nr:hypothetical protein [Schlesneria sp.]